MKKTITILIILAAFGQIVFAQNVNWVESQHFEWQIDSLKSTLTINNTAHEVLKINKKTLICNSDKIVVSIEKMGNLYLLTACGDITTEESLILFNIKIGDKTIEVKPKTTLANKETEIKNNQLLPYYDALLLKEGRQISEIYKKYGIIDNSNTLLPEILFNANVQANSVQNTSLGNLLQKTSKLDITKYAEGFGKFIAVRVKEELALAYFNSLKQKLNDTKFIDAQTLFPNTTNQLNAIDNEIYNYKNYISSIKQNMQYDCKMLPYNLYSIIKEEKNSLIFNNLLHKQNLRFLSILAFDYGMALTKGQNIGQALDGISTEYIKNTDTLLIEKVALVKLLSASLMNNSAESQNYWVSANEITKMINDPKHFQYYIGLVAQIAKNKQLKLGQKTVFEHLINHKNKLNSLIDIFQPIKQASNSLNQIENFTDDEKEMKSLTYFDASQNLFKTVGAIDVLLGKPQTNEIILWSQIIENILQIQQAVITKKYSSALVYVGALLKALDPNSAVSSDLLSFITTKAQFIAQMAEAQNANEVAIVLENFAAPVGSWRDKRHSKINIAFDSYVGPGYFSQNNQMGISTPIGISVSKGFKNNSVSLLTSLLDIGPITAAQISNTSTENSKIFLRDIFAPGLNLSFGFGQNNPLFLNIGWLQQTKIESTKITKKTGPMASFNINIPILNLYKNSNN